MKSIGLVLPFLFLPLLTLGQYGRRAKREALLYQRVPTVYNAGVHFALSRISFTQDVKKNVRPGLGYGIGGSLGRKRLQLLFGLGAYWGRVHQAFVVDGKYIKKKTHFFVGQFAVDLGYFLRIRQTLTIMPIAGIYSNFMTLEPLRDSASEKIAEASFRSPWKPSVGLELGWGNPGIDPNSGRSQFCLQYRYLVPGFKNFHGAMQQVSILYRIGEIIRVRKKKEDKTPEPEILQ